MSFPVPGSEYSAPIRIASHTLASGGIPTFDFECLARLRLHPFAVDVAFLLEEGFIIKLVGIVSESYMVVIPIEQSLPGGWFG